MKFTKNIKILIFVLIILIIVSIFFIPVLISIYKIKQKINQINITLKSYGNKKYEFSEKLEISQNTSEFLQKVKDEEISKLKELIKMNSFYGQSIEEEKSDFYLTERRTDEFKVFVNLYENNNISTHNIINNLQKFFINNTIENYYYNTSNVLLVSSIIKNQSDIDFIYNKIIQSFYSDIKNDNNFRYVLGGPCYKASIDTNQPYIFHKKCDKYGHTIMFIKTDKTRFGGITDLSWGGRYNRGTEYENTKTRLFNLDTQKIFIYDKNQKVSRYMPPICAENYYLACFGFNDIYLGYLPWESKSAFPGQFRNNYTTNDYNDLLNEKIVGNEKSNEINFEYLDVEVYPIIIINEIKK